MKSKEIVLSEGTKIVVEQIGNNSSSTIKLTVIRSNNKKSTILLTANSNNFMSSDTEQNIDYIIDSYFDYEQSDFGFTVDDKKLVRKTLRPFIKIISSDSDEE